MDKYYLQIEVRYSIPEPENLEPGEYFRTHHNRFVHSDLFDTEKECIDFGNKTIEANLWMEQYPGTIGQRLNRKFGTPIVRFSLKNRAEIYITVNKLNVQDFTNIDLELQKFNIPKIQNKIL